MNQYPQESSISRRTNIAGISSHSSLTVLRLHMAASDQINISRIQHIISRSTLVRSILPSLKIADIHTAQVG
jgi:hypothetical protein